MAFNRLRRDRNIKLVILDTSAILMIFEFSIDIDDEILRLIGKSHILIPKTVINEIEILSNKGKGKKKEKAKACLDYIKKKYESIDIKIEKIGDDAIIEYAKKLNAIVVTNDKELRKNLKKYSIPIIYLRGKQKLVLD